MAVQFSAISNNWTDATWQTVDSTSYLKSEVASTTTTTSYVASSSFTPGAITIDGILLRIKGTTTSPTGTFSVELYNSTGALSVATVTCNATDITNNNTGYGGGWVYFKFSSAQLLIAATNYQVRIKSSVAGTVTVYRNATAGNWSRGLVTTTTASLAASDDVIICGNVTAAATTTVNTVTYNYSGANSYASLEVGAYGKLAGQTSASTAYALTIDSGCLIRIAHNGIIEIGTSASRFPSTSTFTITLTNASAGVNGIDVRNYGTFRAFGAVKTRNCLLSANAAVSATSLTTNVSTGWKANDNIAIAGTGGNTQQQQRTLSVDASGTTLTISSGLSYATEGTSPVQADLINLTSNIRILGSSVALCGYTKLVESSVYDVDQVEYRYMGYTGGISAINITGNANATLGTVSIKNCTFWDYNNYCIQAGGYYGGITVDGCVFYSSQTNSGIYAISLYIAATYTTNATSYIKNCVFIGGGISVTWNTYYTTILDTNTFANNSGEAVKLVAYMGNLGSPISNTKIYRCATSMDLGLASSSYVCPSFTVTNLTVFRCNYGIFLGLLENVTFDTFTLFGNTSANIAIHTQTIYGAAYGYSDNVKFINGSIQAGTSVVCPIGITFDAVQYCSAMNIIFERCNFGTVTTHNVGDIRATNLPHTAIFNNCSFGSSTVVANSTAIWGKSKLSFQRFNGVAGSHKTYKACGVLSSDSVIYASSPLSLRLTPNNAVYKLESTGFQVAVDNGNTSTISIKVRKSVVGDGTAYNGAQPRLILKSNPSAGSSYNANIVCATATNAANGAWETLSYTLPVAVTDNVGMEFYVDCDGTTGWINIDTIAVT